MIDRTKIEGTIGRIRAYREQLPTLPESVISGWNERPQRYCEFVEGNLRHLQRRVLPEQEGEFIQALNKTIKEIKDFSAQIQDHGLLDEAERAQEKAIEEAMATVQGILDELFSERKASMAKDLTLTEVVTWADQHEATITFHHQGGITLQTPGYPTQVAYSIQAAIKGCEFRIAEMQYGRDETASLARAETPSEPYTGEDHYL